MRPVVVMDVFRTLLEFDGDHVEPATWHHLATWLAYRGVVVDDEELGDLFGSTTEQHLQTAASPTPDVEVLEVWRDVLTALGAPPEALTDRFLGHLALEWRQVTTRHIDRWPGTIEMLDIAREAGARLAIASNTQRAYTEAELRMLGLLPRFEVVVFSSDVRAAKPDPAVLAEACAQLDVAPQHAVYMGDNPHDDVAAATTLGMPCVLLHRGTQPAQPPRHEPTVRIDDGDGVAGMRAALRLASR